MNRYSERTIRIMGSVTILYTAVCTFVYKLPITHVLGLCMASIITTEFFVEFFSKEKVRK